MLKNAIKEKVLEVLPEDDELPEDEKGSAETLAQYLVVILSRGCGRSEVLEELRSVLEASPEADMLYKW